MARLIRDEGVLLSVALAATLWSSAALSQAETETEVAPSQPVNYFRLLRQHLLVPNQTNLPVHPPRPLLRRTRPVLPRPPQLRCQLGLPRPARWFRCLPGLHVPSGRIPRAGSQGFLGRRPKRTKFRDDADSCERARRVYHHSGCAGWNKGGGAFRATRAQHQGRA